MDKTKKRFLDYVRSQIDLAIEKESKDLKKDEKVKVKIDVNEENIVIHAVKVKK
jgi:hypothetical protein|tara:strand:+ start:340 stop:501 length:162 start_codon:yes stop_codon:yes gene_type:complete